MADPTATELLKMLDAAQAGPSARDLLTRLDVEAGRNPDGTYGNVPEGMVFNPGTGQYTNRDMMAANEKPGPLGAAGMGFMQGYTLNAADEAAGLAGGEFAREKFRAEDEAAQGRPLAYFLGQLAGNVVSPANKVMGPIKTIKKAVGVGGVQGAVDAFNRQEGTVGERLDNWEEVAAAGLFSGVLSGAASATLKFGSPALRRMFSKTESRPTLENLKNTKDMAYRLAERSGVNFDNASMRGLFDDAKNIANNADIDVEVEPYTRAALKLLKRRANEPKVSLRRLDETRKKLWQYYHQSGDKEGLILDFIWEIDKVIEKSATGNDLMKAARLANSRYSKAKLLEGAFRKAELQTASTGSGGNILNKYRQAVTSILTNPKHAKWFSEQELALMDRFVRGDDVENSLRRVGKLAPNGNGLMLALNVYAATVDPAMLSITAAGALAKNAADTGAMRGSEELLDAVSTGVIRPPANPDLSIGVGAGIAGPEYLRNR